MVSVCPFPVSPAAELLENRLLEKRLLDHRISPEIQEYRETSIHSISLIYGAHLSEFHSRRCVASSQDYTLPNTTVKHRIRQSSSGEHYMSVAPDMSSVKWAAAQKAHRQKFRGAAAYASAALADPHARVYYRERAAQEKERPYNLALSDGFKGIDPLKKKK